MSVAPEHKRHHEISPRNSMTYLRTSSEDDGSEITSVSGQHDEHEGLPPIDRGRHAWSFIIGACLVECLGWGLPLSFGIFQAYYSKQELFQSQSRTLPIIGSTTTGIAHLAVPLITPIVQTFPRYEQEICWFGGFLCVASLIASSFATHVWHLIIFQGMLYALGWVFCSVPMLSMTNEWFVERRGLAYGIIFSSSGVGGLILPFFLENLLARLGFRWTLRVTALVLVLICGPGLPLLRPRYSKTGIGSRANYGNSEFLKQKVFWLFSAAIFLQALGFWLPRFFLPSYAHELSLSNAQGALLLAVFSLAQATGQIALGGTADLVIIHIPTALSTGVCAVASLLLWGPAKGLTSLAFFSTLFAFFGGPFPVLISIIALKEVANDSATTLTVYGMFMFERGLGGILGGPASTLLTRTEVDTDYFGLLKYQGVVWFVGLSMALSVSLIWLAYILRKVPKNSSVLGNGSSYQMDQLATAASVGPETPILFDNLTIEPEQGGIFVQSR